MSSEGGRLSILVKGIVQGVGFRPFVFRLAGEMALNGYVKNTPEGVLIEAGGGDLETFLRRLQMEAPPLARITEIITDFASASADASLFTGGFRILQSDSGGLLSPSILIVSPDISVCAHCLSELAGEADRRHLYPFTNCTNCGPRYSIIKTLPYDRGNTTMSPFTMCPECQNEYIDPADRRFHAEPNACPRCGPSLRVFYGGGQEATAADRIETILGLLADGKIVALKGVGGFHLAADALNPHAVKTLRERKRKNNRPFALMAGDLETVKRFCHVSAREEELLSAPRRPIVLLRKKQSAGVPEEVAPRNCRLGFMLPYTPLHWLLFNHPAKGSIQVLVMTSGNLSEEPIIKDNGEALESFSHLADAIALHDRDIHTRVDDSVVAVSGMADIFMRRARGYCPEPIRLSGHGPEVMGVGADLKNTFTLTKGGGAVISQHIGDMESPKTMDFFEQCLDKLKALYDITPEALAHDLHPDYHSTRWALEQKGIPKLPIQHHYAHVASVMAEKGLRGKCIGVAFDGTGYGTDGTLWGGEFLIAGIAGFARAGHIKPFPLPGGEQAVREPWRVALSLIREFAGKDALEFAERVGLLKRHAPDKAKKVLDICGTRFSPLSSGAGRVFDAASALLGLADVNTFEGEAAMALEAVAFEGLTEDYPVDVIFKEPMQVDFSMTFYEMVKDIAEGRPAGVVSTKFHNTVAEAVGRVVSRLFVLTGVTDVVLSGGVFQNLYLLEATMQRLGRGLRVHVNEVVPPNDAGISLGQAYILRERLKAEEDDLI